MGRLIEMTTNGEFATTICRRPSPGCGLYRVLSMERDQYRLFGLEKWTAATLSTATGTPTLGIWPGTVIEIVDCNPLDRTLCEVTIAVREWSTLRVIPDLHALPSPIEETWKERANDASVGVSLLQDRTTGVTHVELQVHPTDRGAALLNALACGAVPVEPWFERGSQNPAQEVIVANTATRPYIVVVIVYTDSHVADRVVAEFTA